MTRLLEGLTFTETEQVAENQLGIDAVELLKQKEKENEELKRANEQKEKENEEQKKRIAELEATKTGGAGNKEVWILLFLLFLFLSDSLQLCCTMFIGCSKVEH